jgi:hypothetical protein
MLCCAGRSLVMAGLVPAAPRRMQNIRPCAAGLLKPLDARGGGEAWMAGTCPAKTRRGANDRHQASIRAPRVAKNLAFPWPAYILFFRSLKTFDNFARRQGFSKFFISRKWVISMGYGAKIWKFVFSSDWEACRLVELSNCDNPTYSNTISDFKKDYSRKFVGGT